MMIIECEPRWISTRTFSRAPRSSRHDTVLQRGVFFPSWRVALSRLELALRTNAMACRSCSGNEGRGSSLPKSSTGSATNRADARLSPPNLLLGSSARLLARLGKHPRVRTVSMEPRSGPSPTHRPLSACAFGREPWPAGHLRFDDLTEGGRRRGAGEYRAPCGMTAGSSRHPIHRACRLDRGISASSTAAKIPRGRARRAASGRASPQAHRA